MQERDLGFYESAFNTYLRKKGLRATRQRAQIVNYILSRPGHFTAEEIHTELARRKARVSRATVYRTLALLSDARLLSETVSTNAETRFELTLGNVHHDHLVCLSCGKVIEFRSPTIESHQQRVCSRYKFVPVEYRLQIAGYCSECARRSSGRGTK